MLLRECLSDPDCGKFSVVIVDEAHERTIDTDTVLGLLKRILQRRPMLRVVVMSATLDIEKIESFFPGAPLVRVSGRRHDVSVHYMPHPVKDYVETAVACVTQIHEREAGGDILCFLTGVAEIENAVAKTKLALGDAVVEGGAAGKHPEQRERPRHVVVLPLYGTLQLEEQKKVFQAYGDHVRKIIFSTNIAETSVTIDGVVYVVDCGYQKQTLYASEGRMDYLLPAVISKAAAEQRKGRAGRTKPGKCYRLFTMENYEKFPDQTYPEILRNNFVNTLLLLLQLGVANPCDFPFIDAPPDTNMEEAFYQLMYFGAVDEELQLTAFGRQLALVPLDVCLARMLLKSASHGCAADAAVVAAMLQAGQVFLRPAHKAQQADQMHAALLDPTGGDHAGLFHVFHAYYRHQNSGEQFCYEHFLRHQSLQQALKVYHQLRALMATMQVPVRSTYRDNVVDTVALRKAILEGYFMQVAYWSVERSTYLTVRDGMPIRPHPQSSLGKKGAPRPPWILYDRIEVQGDAGACVRVACGVDVSWLLEVSTFYTNPTEINDGEILVALDRAKEQQTGGTS
ncbi:pre-mRNA-splicing factor ATP-dependent RNA helicase DHX15/PRP43 [Strigomonas culicis]|nr:pre-mRNA-splicing factor ATP-dependent RNA helicase DHX15/PRP43 [Strigomonas culicis]|eukprot:EPY21207.1 pre-mRNA-splicing factor ATP-dependent RNA helicase DHX15/PRP43 [Strigomonas culicis]